MVFSGGIDSKIVQFQQITNKVQSLFVIDVSYSSQVQSNISIDKCIT